MTTITIETKITYKYLMNKSKHDLAHMILSLFDELDEREYIITGLREERLREELDGEWDKGYKIGLQGNDE
jgi:hypothetical protein